MGRDLGCVGDPQVKLFMLDLSAMLARLPQPPVHDPGPLTQVSRRGGGLLEGAGAPRGSHGVWAEWLALTGRWEGRAHADCPGAR